MGRSESVRRRNAALYREYGANPHWMPARQIDAVLAETKDEKYGKNKSVIEAIVDELRGDVIPENGTYHFNIFTDDWFLPENSYNIDYFMRLGGVPLCFAIL